MEKLYSCEEVAKRYAVKIETVWAWIRAGQLPAIKIGKSYRVKESYLIAFERAARTAD